MTRRSINPRFTNTTMKTLPITHQRNRQTLFIFALALCLFSTGAWFTVFRVQAATLTVTNTNDSRAGSLRQAVANAAAGDTIDFTGLSLPATITLTSGQIEITKSLTIAGPGARQLTINGGNASRIFLINDGNNAVGSNVSISGLSLVQGNGVGGTQPGGGSPQMQGGALFCLENLTLTNCTVSGNTSVESGGGAVFNNQATSTIQGCTFSGNTCSSSGADGGGLLIDTAHVTVVNSTFSGNTAGNWRGAARLQQGAFALFLNCTVVSNTANGGTGGGGGGAFLASGAGAQLLLRNTIVAGNTAVIAPSANDLTVFSPAVLTANNSVIGDAGSAGGLTNGVNGNIVGVNGSGVRALNTIINTTLANNGGPTNTHFLAAGSVAINAGNDPTVAGIPYDQRGAGFVRLFNGTVDIGAIESPLEFPGVAPLGLPAQVTGSNSLDFTVPPGINRLLVVTASNATNPNYSGASFGGVSMLHTRAAGNGGGSDSIFFLVLGTSTSSTSGTITVSGYLNTSDTFLTAQAFQNVDQTLPIDGGRNQALQGANVNSLLLLTTPPLATQCSIFRIAFFTAQ
ncbi:MAG: hypothetical protein HY011_01695 [Acidobacteria bacterium]|nr:hypothetical protein [Acidobacteriota bacterium]